MRIERGLLLLAASAITVVALTGCTSGPTAVDRLKPDTSGTVRTLPQPTIAKIASTAQTGSGVSMPWKFVEFGPNRRTIQVVYAKGDGWCVLPVGFSVKQESGAVVVTAVSRSTGHSTCPSDLKVGRAWVHLPISITGKMKLEHAPVDSNWNSPNLLD